MKRLILEETDSTNTYAAQNSADLDHLTMIVARSQTAGRGQRGNHWESEPGKNLTFSLLLKPDSFPARKQFLISEAFALAIADAIGDFGVPASVKWPNDIYSGDGKICGILIEHSVMGTGIFRSICGAGININQTRFLSDAPNPISMANILGREISIEDFSARLEVLIEKRLGLLDDPADHPVLHAEYLRRLWRGKGFHPFRDAATGQTFRAEIADVEPMGHLILREPGGASRRYAFKEVEFLI